MFALTRSRHAALRVFAYAVCLTGTAAPVAAHGGVYIPPPPYHGPGDVTPPGTGGPRTGRRSPSSPAPTGPSAPTPAPSGPTTGVPAPAPAPAGPATGGPAMPAAGGLGGAGPRTGPRGVTLTVDRTTWDYWWEYNKDAFLQLRRTMTAPVATGSDDFFLGATRARDRSSVRPARARILQEVLPALKRALDGSDQRDITTSCLIAMAKIGEDHPQFRLLDEFRARLDVGDQEVRETAALAIGIAGKPGGGALETLTSLANVDATGRGLSGGAVNARTRAFACYALGLIAAGSTAGEVDAAVLDALAPILADRKLRDRDVRVAAVHGIGAIGTDGEDYRAAIVHRRALSVLEDYFVAELGPGEEWLQAHGAIAIARLAGRRGAVRYKRLFVDELQAKGAQRRGNAILQSCVQALGWLAEPNDGPDAPDAAVSELLLDVSREHNDVMTRRFALMALGRIGGAANREALLREFDRASKAQRRPWCALALGVLAHGQRERGRDRIDRVVVETLRDEFRDAKQPDLVGALAVALGLCGDHEAGDMLCERLADSYAREKMAGYLCIGLALVGDRRHAPDVRRAMDQARFRPLLLVQAAIALGKLGDREAGDALLLQLEARGNLVTMAACAQGLGQIGDRRAIAPLITLLDDDRLAALSRAFAAAALGGVCDHRLMPWNAGFREGINYEANVPTLTDQASGVLDIL